jgi:hypothetical protein
VVLLNPFGLVPGRGPGAGAWGDAGRIAQVAAIPGVLFVEDSGLLVAVGREPLVDDVFLWSRNRAREVAGTLSFSEGALVLESVRAGRFDAVVAEVELARLDDIGGYERQRWHRISSPRC